MPRLAGKPFRALEGRNFRLFFLGQVISLSGTWMQSVAQAWLVLVLTGSGTWLGFIVAMQTLPVLFGGIYGGVLADKFNKRKVLIATQTAAGLQALLLAALVATGSAQLWMVAALAFLLGCINAVDVPTRQSFVSEMVGTKHIMNAVSLNSVIMNMARIVGPAIAGILIATIGIAPCFFVNAVSFAAVIAALLFMKPEQLHRAPKRQDQANRLSEGLRYAWSHPEIRTPLFLMVIVGTFAYEFQVTLPLFARFTFNTGATGFGALSAALGAGAVVGGLASATRVKTNTRFLALATLAFGTALAITALAPTFATALVLVAVVGICSIFFSSTASTTLQLASPPNMRGRVMALFTVAFLGSTPIGGPIVGWIGQSFGARWSLALGGIATLLAATAAWRSLSGLQRKYPDGPAAPVELEVAEVP